MAPTELLTKISEKTLHYTADSMNHTNEGIERRFDRPSYVTRKPPWEAGCVFGTLTNVVP